MPELHNEIVKEQDKIKELLEGFGFVMDSIDSIRPEDTELRDLELLKYMRKKCEQIEERVQQWYGG